LESRRGKPNLRQHLGMALMHRRQAVPQSDLLLGEPDANHASIIQRTLLREIALFGCKQMMSVGLVAPARCLPISARVTSNTLVLAQARKTE
jgi:hypothetical protein